MIRVTVAILAGLIAAFHMGKVPGALPYLTDFFSLSLRQSGLVVSSFSLISAAFGLIIGILASRIGLKHAGAIGLFTVSCGAVLGASSDGFALLIVSRVMEGFGFVMVAISMPGLINQICPPKYRAVAMGVWGAFIPAAMTLMLIVSPTLISAVRWQGLWWFTATCTLFWLAVFMVAFRNLEGPPKHQGGIARVTEVLLPEPVKVVLIFVCYSALFAAVTAFLPTFWHQQYGMTAADASLMSAIAVAGNIVGNVLAGFLVGRGVSLSRLATVAMISGGVFASLIFAGLIPIGAQVVAATLFTLCAGILPGAVFASLPHIVPRPALIPLLIGCVFQGAGIGQVLGPMGIASAVEMAGSWIGGSGFIIAVALIAALIGNQIRTTERLVSHPNRAH